MRDLEKHEIYFFAIFATAIFILIISLICYILDFWFYEFHYIAYNGFAVGTCLVLYITFINIFDTKKDDKPNDNPWV